MRYVYAMSGDSNYPPPRSQSKSTNRNGCLVFLFGTVVALAPILIVLIASIFAGVDVWNESESSLGALPWLIFFTFPVGGIICIIGLALWITKLTRKKK